MTLAERVYARWRASFHGGGVVMASSPAAQAWLDDAMALGRVRQFDLRIRNQTGEPRVAALPVPLRLASGARGAGAHV